MTNKLISGSRRSEDLIRSYLTRNIAPSDNKGHDFHPPVADNITPPITTTSQNSGIAYHIPKSRFTNLPTEYVNFLRDAGHFDLSRAQGLSVEKYVLRINPDVRNSATSVGVSLTGNDGEYVRNINQTDARKLVHSMGAKLLTTSLMYNVFIPYVKELSDQGDTDAKKTLDEIVSNMAEWLDDRIEKKKTLIIGSEKKKISLPGRGGKFNRGDIGDYGYPSNVNDNGEFYFYAPRDNNAAVIRGGGAELSLILDRAPASTFDGLGVRLAKIFS